MKLMEKIDKFERTVGTVEVFNSIFTNCPLLEGSYVSESDIVEIGEVERTDGDVTRKVYITHSDGVLVIDHLFRNDNMTKVYEEPEFNEETWSEEWKII